VVEETEPDDEYVPLNDFSKSPEKGESPKVVF
jgi:hypothetical protein